LEDVGTFLANNGKQGWGHLGVYQCQSATCFLSTCGRPADGVGPASPPELMARECSSTKDSLSVLPGRTCST
jgi:hypothetical protein